MVDPDYFDKQDATVVVYFFVPSTNVLGNLGNLSEEEITDIANMEDIEYKDMVNEAYKRYLDETFLNSTS